MDYNKYISDFANIISEIDQDQVVKTIDLIWGAYNKDKMIFVIGNGGSAANASHFAQDLAKGTRVSLNQKKRIKALSLTDNLPFVSALGNDDGYETIFEQQLRTFASTGDLLIAISGSGNSPNIINAVSWANENDLITLGVTGFNGGKLKQINKYNLHVPLNDMCTSESVHSFLFHFIVLEITAKMKQLNS